MTRHGLIALGVVTAGLSSCAGQTTLPARPAEVQRGQHAFRAVLPGGVTLAGTVVVTGDTIVPRLSVGECRPATGASRQYFAYDCTVPGTPEIVLAFDRANPMRRSRWGLNATVRKTRSVCTAWRTWENGTRTCTRSQPEEYFETAMVWGDLMIDRG